MVDGHHRPRSPHQRGDHRARRRARAHRDRRHGDRDAQGQARLRARHQGPQGHRVLTRGRSAAFVVALDRPGRRSPSRSAWPGPEHAGLALRPRTMAVSSAPLGGGIGPCAWVINAQVPHAYDRRDPAEHLREMAAACSCAVRAWGCSPLSTWTRMRWAEDGGAVADVSVGITSPTWAAAPDEPARAERAGRSTSSPSCPARLSHAALVNVAMTVTEAKAQALWDAGVQATGTASDAVCRGVPVHGARKSPSAAPVRRGGRAWPAPCIRPCWPGAPTARRPECRDHPGARGGAFGEVGGGRAAGRRARRRRPPRM